jgi:hypothetical protein
VPDEDDKTKDESKAEEEEPKAAEEPTDDEDEEEEDSSGIDAIAKRAEALGGDDEIERIAREEEEKLAARRARQRTGRKKKGGLQASASKRLARIGEKAKPKRAIPTAVEAADPLIERTQRLAEWARKNRNLVQGLIVAAVLAAIGGGIWYYYDLKRESEASAALAVAVADQRGRLGDPDQDDEEGIHDPTPVFRTDKDRRAAALGKYREVETKFKGTGAAWLARLGEGALLLDQRDADGAIAAFKDVAGSSLAQADPEIRGRVTENLGFAYELRAELHPDQRDKNLDEALAQYKQLESSDVFGFAQMAPYHEARCYEAKGDKKKALELLKKLRDDLMKNPDSRLFSDLKDITDDRIRALDPTALPPKRAEIGPGGEITPEMLEKLPPELRNRILKNLGRSLPQ